MSDDAASLRKLWYLAKELCKSEMEKLASGDEASRVKVGLPSAVAMENSAVGRGMPKPASDAERPSLFGLTRLARSLVGSGASFEYVPWEAYLSLEEERRMERAGTLPKARGEVVLAKDHKLTLKEKESDAMPWETTNDMETLRKRLDLRARAVEMLEVGKYNTYRGLHDRYIGTILAEVPEGMRPPTIQEVRRFDRALHQEILRWLSREVGTLDGGVAYHMENNQLGLWRLLDPVLRNLPDQGTEKRSRGASKRTAEHDMETEPKRAREGADTPERDLTPLPRRRPEGDAGRGKNKNKNKNKMVRCLVCKERHKPLCKMPEGWRRQLRDDAKAREKAEKAEKDGKAKAPPVKKTGEAREIPIPGVLNPPRPLRSEDHPSGIPHEVSVLSNKSKKKLNDDTFMADLSAEKCADAHLGGKYFTLEHPARSLAQHLASWKRLLGLEGVFVVNYHTCMFEGSRRKKNQMLICNHPAFRCMGQVCSGGTYCERTGLKHLKWRPTTANGKVVQFTTGDEREYPQGFCKEYAKCAASVLGSDGSFVEVFSGPNAPLSRAMCEQWDEELKGSRLNTERGLKVEMQRLAQVTDTSKVLPATPLVNSNPRGQRPPESASNRLAMLEAGRQPSYGKREQLIPDGLQSEKGHLEEALRLQHPFETQQVLKADHEQVISQYTASDKDMNCLRLQVLAD
eukprot:s4096_g6.t1